MLTEQVRPSLSPLAQEPQVETAERADHAWVGQPGAVEIIRLLTGFLQSPGHVLLVQGSPGSGKTSLALEILFRMDHTHKLYASTRVSPAKLRLHFPWIDEVMDNMTGRMAKSTWIDELHDLRRAEPDNMFNQVLRLKHSKRKALLVIDSWEGALRNSNEDGRRMMESGIFSELDESGVSVVIVSEGKIGGLDYLVDGIVTLGQFEADGRKLRSLEVNKLRGLKVSTPRVLFSLDRARFTQIPSLQTDGEPVEPKTLVPRPHYNGLFSTGCVDLDNLLGGGIRRGAFVLLELESPVPPLSLRVLLNIMRANFINQGGSCFIVPTGSYSSESVAESLRPIVGDEAFEERVRITEYNPSLPDRKWRIMLKGDLLADVSTFHKAWISLARATPNVMLNGDLDKLVQVYGEGAALPGFAGLGESLRDGKAMNLQVGSRDTKMKDEFKRTADYHLKIKVVEGSFLICGVKPFTPFHGARLSYQKGYPSLNLVEAV